MESVKGKILKIYISNTDKFRHRPLYEVIVYAAKRYGLAGATATRGYMGFGASSKVTNAKFWEITEKVPVVVEIIDTDEKIEHFKSVLMAYIEKIPTGCLVTSENIEIVLIKKGQKKKRWL